jgi:hypothetical protein
VLDFNNAVGRCKFAKVILVRVNEFSVRNEIVYGMENVCCVNKSLRLLENEYVRKLTLDSREVE